MVGTWTPEPPREPCNENLFSAGSVTVVVEQLSTDSEDEDAAAYSGYEPLPQLPTDPSDSGSDDPDEGGNGGDVAESSSSETVLAVGHGIEDNGAAQSQFEQGRFEEERCAELREVWSAPSGSNIEMGSEQADQVRAAMANFALPASAIPAWASAVPEEQWKQQLLDRIQRLQQRQGDEHSKS